MTEPKLLVFDLDGTLLDAKRRVPEDVHAFLVALRARGIETTLATGRPFASARRFVEDLNVGVPVIVFNGAVIASPEGRSLWSRRLPKQAAREALSLLQSASLSSYIYLEVADSFFYTDRTGAATKYIMTKDGVDCRIERDLLALVDRHDADPIKLFSIGPREELEKVQQAFLAAAPGFTCVFSEHDMLEFLGDGVTKGKALHVLCEHVGIATDKVMAFGDNLNDLEMIQEAGVGVSMTSAPEALRRAASATTENLASFLRSRFRDALEMEEQRACE